MDTRCDTTATGQPAARPPAPPPRYSNTGNYHTTSSGVGVDDEVATVVLNRAALDDALATPLRRVERGTGRSADRRRSKNGTRRNLGPHDTTTAATHTPTSTPAVPANAGIWLAVVAVGLTLVTAMLIITITWT